MPTRLYAGHALFREAYKRKKAPPLESPEWGFSRRSPLTRPHAAGDAFDELTTV